METGLAAPPAEALPTALAGGWTVYIIESEQGLLYTGITTEPERRFREHASGKGARWFRGRVPRRFVYLEPCADRASALRREAAIKRLPRAAKLALAAVGVAP
jgi:putative endonuclease